jgi:hypothetical protein
LVKEVLSLADPISGEHLYQSGEPTHLSDTPIFKPPSPPSFPLRNSLCIIS